MKAELNREYPDSKSGFVRRILSLNPNATFREVLAAWIDAGNSEPLKQSSYSYVKNKLGLGRRWRHRRRQQSVVITASTAQHAEAPRAYSLATQKLLNRFAPGSKSGFIRGILLTNPNASFKEVQSAWTAAGHTASIPHSLYYYAKKQLGLGRWRRRGERKQTNATAPA